MAHGLVGIDEEFAIARQEVNLLDVVAGKTGDAADVCHSIGRNVGNP